MSLRLLSVARSKLHLCRHWPTYVVLLAILVSSWVQVATPMESAPREYQRQQERERFLRQQQESTPDVHLLPEPSGETDRLPGDEAPCFPIERILMTGEGAEQLQWALGFADRTGTGEDDPAPHRCLGTRGINLVMRRIQHGLVGCGFVITRLLAEPQDVSNGMLRLTVIPGRIRTIRFAEGTDARATV